MIKFFKPTMIDLRGNVNFGYPEGTVGQNNPIAIVYHVEQGSQDGTDSWFANDASDALAHFGIKRDGTIHYHCDELNAPFANGLIQKPSWKFLKPWVSGTDPWLISTDKHTGKQYINPNVYTISIEHEGYTGQPFTPEQYASDLRLTLYLVTKFNILVDSDHLITHSMIDSVDRPNCPGATFPLEKLIEDTKKTIMEAEIKMLVDKYFKDIPESMVWLQESADRCYERKIVQGDGEGNLNPTATATRGEIVAIADRVVEFIFSELRNQGVIK